MADKELFGICLLFVVIHVVAGNEFWVWKCNDEKGFCTRLQNTPDKNDQYYPSLEVCRLVCGTYGPLWPRPSAPPELGRDLVAFSPSAVSFIITATGESLEFLQKTEEYLRNLISNQNASSCSSTNTVKINIFVTRPDVSLTWDTDESYNLEVDTVQTEIAVRVASKTAFGARHALETLSQLIEVYPRSGNEKCLVITKTAKIADRPAYPHRGLLVDTARNYQSIPVLKRHLDAMAASKLNMFHWHITDSQSFPLDLPGSPNMAKNGAYSEDKTYSSEDVKDIQAYAKFRGIKVILEIDAPSHSGNGWQWGPEANLGDLAICVNQQPYRSYCFQPPCGQLNPINEKLYGVLGKLYEDIASTIDIDGIFHMGGDEVNLPCWNSSKDIVDYLHGNTSTESFLDLWSEFQGKALQAFDEAVGGDESTNIILWSSKLTEADLIEKFLPKDRYVIQTWVANTDKLPLDLLELGYKIIVSTKDAWYLDHGFWGTTPYYNWRIVYNNKINNREDGCLGGETCMWGEYVDDYSVEARTWPRAAAAAERLWTNPKTTAEDAETRFYRHRQRLVTRGVNAEALAPRWCYQNEGECR